MSRSYYWNPQQQKIGTGIHVPIDQSIEQCLRSQGVQRKIRRMCERWRLSMPLVTSILKACDHLGRDAVTTAGQKKLSEYAGISIRAFRKYYRILCKEGFLYARHRNRKTPDGARRTTNITIVKVLIEYCERCAAWTRKAANFVNAQASKITKPFKNKGSRLNAPDAARIIYIDSKTGEILDSFPHSPSTEPIPTLG